MCQRLCELTFKFNLVITITINLRPYVFITSSSLSSLCFDWIQFLDNTPHNPRLLEVDGVTTLDEVESETLVWGYSTRVDYELVSRTFKDGLYPEDIHTRNVTTKGNPTEFERVSGWHRLYEGLLRGKEGREENVHSRNVEPDFRKGLMKMKDRGVS